MYEGALLGRTKKVWLSLRDWRNPDFRRFKLFLSFHYSHLWLYLSAGLFHHCGRLLSLLVVGILVDDAIVEIENIISGNGAGKSPYQAAMEAADEIGLAVIATIFIPIAVFCPLPL